MKKSIIKLIAMVLCLAMIGSYLPMAVHAEGTEAAPVEYTQIGRASCRERV